MGKVKKNLGMGKIIAAAFFLFNPNVVIIDVLPDFIGYALLLSGITQLADINYYFEESAKLFKRMLLVSIAQFFALFLVFGILPAREISSALMLMAFAFGALELLLLIPAFKAFFDGFIYLGSRHESTSVFFTKFPKPAKERKKPRVQKPALNATAKASLVTMLFVIIKPIMTFAPEILSMFDTTIDPNLTFNYAAYTETFRVISILLLLPLCITWLITFTRYIVSITKDSIFIGELSKKYTEEVSPKTYLFTQRYIKTAFLILSIAVAFNVDFYIDNASVLPDFISPIIIIGMLLVVRKFGKAPIISYVFAVGYAITSAISYYYNVTFYSKYTLTVTEINANAADMLMTLTVVKIADSVLFMGSSESIIPIRSEEVV